MTESDLLSLSQAVQYGLFVSLDAARKASTRDSRFPAPAAKRGGAFLYDVASLRAYLGARGDPPPVPSPHDELPPPVEGRTWKPIPGARHYEASHRGHIRSVDRWRGGRFYKGVVLKPREDPDGYLRVNITYDDGERKHNLSVARLVLLAHDPDGHAEDLDACHGPGGPQDNRWPENIRWDTKDANREEALAVRLVNSPPKPRPPKVCPRCSKEHGGKGRNCHECVVAIGENAARYLAEGMPLDKVADALDYPPAGVFNLAVRYGSLHLSIRPPLPPGGHAESRPLFARRLRRVLFRRGASRQDSDAR